jgi:hypothetical protein
MVWAAAGFARQLYNLAGHRVWFGVDAGSANFFAHHFVAEFGHD